MQVVDDVKKLLPTFREQLPAAVSLDVRTDRSVAIRESVADVKFTLVLTVVLVILVIFLFLRNLSATVIPSLALPASIVGTFAAMYLLGYSLDNLSLMALTLSVGFVVDDAIVMLENIVRHMEMGKSPMRAAFDGSQEIAFTIVSMTLSLSAVFIPILFMGGVVGRLLHEFSVTIGVAILVSGFVSISLTPMLCSRFLETAARREARPVLQRHREDVRPVAAAVRRHAPGVHALPRRDDGRVDRAHLRHGVPVRPHPEGLPAQRGSGRSSISLEAIQGIGFDEMVRHQEEVANIVGQDPEHRGPDQRSTVAPGWAAPAVNLPGRITIDLKPRDQRTKSVDEIMAELRPKLAQVPGVRAYMVNNPPINLGGTQGARSLYQFTLQDTDTAELYRWSPIFEAQGARHARHRGREQRPPDQESADSSGSRPRQDLGAGAQHHAGRVGALRRVRHATDLADLRAEQSVSGDSAGRAGVSERSGVVGV